MKSLVVRRSISVVGRSTSISLEEEFWQALREIADARNMPLGDLVAVIDANRQHSNLSSAIRQFVLGFYSDQITDLRGRSSLERKVVSELNQ